MSPRRTCQNCGSSSILSFASHSPMRVKRSSSSSAATVADAARAVEDRSRRVEADQQRDERDQR